MVVSVGLARGVEVGREANQMGEWVVLVRKGDRKETRVERW